MPDGRFSAGEAVPGLRYFLGLARKARAMRIDARPPLYARPSGGKTLFSYQPGERFPGIITTLATGGTYGVQEAAFDRGSGKWEVPASGRFVLATEYNATEGIAQGSAVEVRYTAADDWRFVWNTGGLVPDSGGGGGGNPRCGCGCCEAHCIPDTLHITCAYGAFPMYRYAFGNGVCTWDTGNLSVTEPTALVRSPVCGGYTEHRPLGNTISVRYTASCNGSTWTVNKRSDYDYQLLFTCPGFPFPVSGSVGPNYLSPAFPDTDSPGPVLGNNRTRVIGASNTATSDPCAVSISCALVGTPHVVAFDETVTISE